MSKGLFIISSLFIGLIALAFVLLDYYSIATLLLSLSFFSLGVIFNGRIFTSTSAISAGVIYIFLSESSLYDGDSAYRYSFFIQYSFIIVLYISLVLIRSKNSRLTLNHSYIIYILSILVLTVLIPLSVLAYQLGRESAYVIYYGGSAVFKIFGQICFSIAMVLPFVLWQTDGKKVVNKILAVVVITSIALTGNRIGLVASVLPLLSIFELKYRYRTVLLLPALLIVASLMKMSRTGGAKTEFEGVSTEILSNESVIYGTKILLEYGDINYYPRYTGYLLYFWIPRLVWHNKPGMLGYEFVRKYSSGFSVGHSASYGLAGEFYADFGYLGIFVFGLILLCSFLTIGRSFLQSVKHFIPGIVFMALRSPLTIALTMLPVLILYHFYARRKGHFIQGE